jgi:hypothetical protein
MQRFRTRRNEMRTLRAVLVAIALFASAHAAAAAVLSIADARNQPLGTVVTVEGAVTVPSGSHTSSTFDQGFALQDDSGGIYVSSAFDSGLNFHHRVEVTGTVDTDGFGFLVLRPATPGDVVKLPGAEAVEPTVVATGAVGEATEGLLLEVAGTITRGPTDDLPFGYSIFIDDGTGETQIFIPASTGIDPFTIPWVAPGERIQAVGMGGQFLSQYEVLPRHRGDLHRITP